MKLIYRLATVFWILLAFGSLSKAQTTDDTGLWLAYFDTEKLKDGKGKDTPWLAWLDMHARFLDDANGFNQSILRPGLGYQLSDDTSVWGGYAWIRTSPISGDDFDEHRIWQQYIWNPSDFDFDPDRAFVFRTRFEQRWIENSDDTALRLRQFLRTSKPISSGSRITSVLWDELFFHLNDTDVGINSGFDQNRAFVGIGYQPSAKFPSRVEVGYLNQFINSSGPVDRMNHILSINFFY